MPQLSARTEQARSNRALVDEFFDLAINRRDLAGAGRLLAEDFEHHEPTVAPGSEGFMAHLRALLQARPGLRHESVRHICDGDFAVAHGRRTNGFEITATIDIFRLAEGRIREHWQVFQRVPETQANPNGMF